MLDMKILRGESDTEEEQVQPKQGYFSQVFDNIGAWGKAAYANTRELGMGRDIKDVYDRIDKEQYGSREEYDRLVQELDTLQNERNEYRNMFAENQKILNQNDSAFKDFTEVGGTLQGIGTQAKDTLIGAGVGALGGSVLPGIGTAAGASTGATWGNRVGAIHQAIQDADMNAIDAWERVLQEGGTSEQAEQAYQDAFRNNLPTEAMDIISSMYMGGKLTGTAGNILNRVLGKKMAGTVANAAGKVSRFDLPARAGTYVAAKTKNPFIGQAVGAGLSMAENAIEEGVQEPWQDYATERAIDTQRRQYDPNHEGIRDFSVTGEGGLLDYYTTEQGKETALKAAKMGAAFGGVGGLLSHNQFTENGTAHSDSIKAGAQQAKWIEDNKILEDEGNKERYNDIKQTMGQVYDLTEDETESLSVEEVSRMYHEYYTNLYGVGGNRQEQSAVTQADFINAITGEETTRRDIMGEHAEKYINDFGMNPGGETLRSLSDNQQTLSEEQVQDVLTQDEEQTTGETQQHAINAKVSKDNVINNETGSYLEKRTNQTEQKQTRKKGIPDNFGNWRKIEENDEFDHDLNNIGAEAKFENTKTGRIANIKRSKDGYQVTDVTDPKQETKTRNKKNKKEVLNFLNSSWANKNTAFQSNGQVQEEATQALPQEDGVISDKGSGLTEDAQGNQYDNGKLIQSNKAVTIHTMGDLHQYYRDHKDLMSKDLYAEVSRQMMRFGIGKANNTEIVLDLTNRESGGFGSKTTTLDANGAIAKAVVRLYAGADLATAAHELAHLGWMNLSEQDRSTFRKWAVATEGKFVAQVLGMQYDQNFRSSLIEALTNKGQGGSQVSQELWNKIRKEGAVLQTLDILNGTNTEDAIDERFAWEFSNWYAQGYIKGNNPRNIIERILQKACHTLQGALRLLYDTDRYLNNENYNGGEVNDIFSRMSPTHRDTGVRNVETTEQVQQTPYDVGQGVNETVETGMTTEDLQETPYDGSQGFDETGDMDVFATPPNPNQNLSRNVGSVPVNRTRPQNMESGRVSIRPAQETNLSEEADKIYERINQQQPQEQTQTSPATTPVQLAPSMEDQFNQSVIENLKKDKKSESERIKQIEKQREQEQKAAEKAERDRQKQIEAERKAKEKENKQKKSALKKDAENKIKSANSALNQKNPNLEEVEGQVSEVEKAIKNFTEEEFSQRMVEDANKPISSEDKRTINLLNDKLKQLRNKLNDLKEEKQNKSVENQNLTTDNQNATMGENRETESVSETPATEKQPSTVEEEKKFKVPTNKKDVQKLFNIVKNRKEGWQQALNALKQVDPSKLRSMRVEDGNDLWNEQAEPQSGDDLWDTPVESLTNTENETVENAETTEITKTQNSESENITETQNVESEEAFTIKKLFGNRKTQKKEYKDPKIMKYVPKKYIDGVRTAWRDSDGYWIEMKDGWHVEEEGRHTLHGETIADLKDDIRQIGKDSETQTSPQTETQENTEGQVPDEFKHVLYAQYVTGYGYQFDYDNGTSRRVSQAEYDRYREIQDKIREKEELQKERQRSEKRKNIPEDRWSKYRNKEGIISSDSEGIFHQQGEEIQDPIFDIYDDPDSVTSSEEYIGALVSYDPSGALLSNLKTKIKNYWDTKNPVGDVEYWDKAIEAIEEEQENRKDNDGFIKPQDNGSPWTSRMILDNMKEHAQYLQKQNEEETETSFQSKGEQNNENTTRGKEEERVRQQTVQEQERDREVNKKDTGLNGQRGLSRSVQQDDTVLSKTGNNNSGQNNRTDTKFQEAGRNAENQTLLTEEKEKELEDLFWKLIRKKQFHGMDSRWGSGVLDYYKNLSKSTKRHDLNPEYIQGNKGYLTAIKNINDYIHNKYPQYKNVYRGVDGHWRFEFSDKDASFINGFEKLSGKELKTTLGKILKHENLYKFYPELQNTPIHLVRNAEMQKFMDAEDVTEKEYFAAYDPETQSIYINSDMLTDGDARNSLLHEIQHAVQDIEGFANGSYSNAYNNDYNYSEGEKQAVLTEKRSNMSEEEIQNNPRYQTLNTEEKTIIEGQNQEYKPVTDTKMQSNGQTSSNFGYIDKQKDIYSVTFTKSAQKNGENQKKIQFYRNNKSYWRENTNQDGSITFTRALPYQQHQKTITYDDINGKTVGKRKKSKAREYYEAVKDQIIKWLFNDKHFLMKAAQHVGKLESYMRMMVMKDQGAVAGAAIEDGIVKHNSKTGERTKSLNSIIEAVGEDNQTEFLNYCEAFRILDLAKRGIQQKMTPQKAQEIIADVKKSKNAKLFEDQRKNFVEYNHELLWVLVDGGFITEEQYDKFLKVDPNFIPLSKNMEELEGFVDGFRDSKTMINIPMPIHKIGTSMREVKNPFLEMQKRTVEYYVKASRNKAGLIFVNDIANAIAQDAQGDVVAQNQGMVRKLASRDKNGKPISHDSKQNVFYVWNNGEKEYYQVADREIYIALRSFDAEQMGALKKIANATFGFSSRLVRNTATMTPDFGLRNLCRDNLEAFISSEHGFLPFVDSFWGMYQMANDTQWFKEYQSMNGELGTLNRDGEHVATVEHDIRDNVKFWKTYFPLIKKDFRELTDKSRSKKARAKSLLLLATDVTGLHSIYKMNKRMNDYLEIGTRIGEYRNARMGYKGLSGRLFGNNSNTILTNDNDLKRASTSQMYAAYKSKDITLNFGQHGILGKELNRYIPFFNASLQGIYKVGNTLDNMIHGKDARTKQELRFKFLLMAAIGMSAALAGTGDDDYDEAPDYEHDNFWILPNGVRIPKDQLFGRLVGGTIEKATHQYLKDGDVKKLELVQDVLGNFAIDKCTPALIDLGFGIVGNYDTFKGRSVTPEYMAEKLGYLQKDLSTSKLGADISEAMFKVFGVDIGAKKVDFVFSKTLSNLGKYVQSLYELTGHNEKMTRGAEPEDKGGFAETSKELPYPMNSIVGTFATNRNTFQSISDFYDRHKELKKLSSDESIMSKDEKKAWEAYQKAYKEDKKYRDALKAIKLDKSLTGAQKRQKADKIFKQQIKMARKLKDWEKKHGLA